MVQITAPPICVLAIALAALVASRSDRERIAADSRKFSSKMNFQMYNERHSKPKFGVRKRKKNVRMVWMRMRFIDTLRGTVKRMRIERVMNEEK